MGKRKISEFQVIYVDPPPYRWNSILSLSMGVHSVAPSPKIVWNSWEGLCSQDHVALQTSSTCAAPVLTVIQASKLAPNFRLRIGEFKKFHGLVTDVARFWGQCNSPVI